MAKEKRNEIIAVTIMILIISLVIVGGVFLVISMEKSKNNRSSFMEEECIENNLTIKYNSQNNKDISYCYEVDDNVMIRYYHCYLNEERMLCKGGRNL